MKEEHDIASGISLVELFSILFKNIYLIIITTLFITGIGNLYTLKFVNPTYTSSSDIMVQVDITSGSSETANDVDLTATLRLVQSALQSLYKKI